MKKIKKSVLISLILMFILLITGCKQISDPIDDKKDIENELIVFLHAGGSYDELTHLNAQETFEYYYNQGYRYFEYDLKLSSDGKIISTHDWEHLDVYNPTITYEEFKTLKLSNGFTPANEEWIIETIKKYPDVIFIIDAKMNTTEGDAAVLTRLEELESIYNLDISKNIIPEVFSIEMWKIVKKETSFDKYLTIDTRSLFAITAHESFPSTVPATSTLTFNTILFNSSSLKLYTYAFEPRSPLSSLPHHINLSVLEGLFSKKYLYNSKIITLPAPLSYAPLLNNTLSK